MTPYSSYIESLLKENKKLKEKINDDEECKEREAAQHKIILDRVDIYKKHNQELRDIIDCEDMGFKVREMRRINCEFNMLRKQIREMKDERDLDKKDNNNFQKKIRKLKDEKNSLQKDNEYLKKKINNLEKKRDSIKYEKNNLKYKLQEEKECEIKMEKEKFSDYEIIVQKEKSSMLEQIIELEEKIDSYKSENIKLKYKLKEDKECEIKMEKALIDYNKKTSEYLNGCNLYYKEKFCNYERIVQQEKSFLIKQIEDVQRQYNDYKVGNECITNELNETSTKLNKLKNIASIAQLSLVGMKRKKKLKWQDDKQLVKTKTYFIEDDCNMSRNLRDEKNQIDANDNNTINETIFDQHHIEDDCILNETLDIDRSKIDKNDTIVINDTISDQVNIDIDFDELNEILYLKPQSIPDRRIVV